MDELIKELKALNFPQRQDSTTEQLLDLIRVANMLGMYDAADAIETWLGRENYQPSITI